MGGQNHQPCSHYLDLSIKLSRLVSLITISIQLANVYLEDLLLSELRGESTNINIIIAQLSKAKHRLHLAIKVSNDLRDRMQRLEYIDLAPLHSLNLFDIGENLSENGIVDKNAWNKMSSVMKTGSFYANLNIFDLSLEKTISDISSLISIFEDLQNRQVMISRVVEENQIGNFKKQFAQLFSGWLTFQQEFLASAILSTEVFYSATKVGSICPNQDTLNTIKH